MKKELTYSKKEKSTPSFTIMPDFGGAYIWYNRLETFEEPELSEMAEAAHRISGKFPKKLMQDFERWSQYFEANAFDEHKLRKFDWNWFHAEGVNLAVKLKAICAESARVIFEKPFEDPNVNLNERREVLVDGQLIEAQNQTRKNNK